MDNLASIDKLMIRNGELVPCIKILRGIQLASRQQGAKFVIEMSFSYLSGGVEVRTDTIKTLVSATKGVEDPTPDPMWCDVLAPGIALRDRPDAGVRITCNATITITAVSGIVTPCSPIDTQFVVIS